MGIKRNATALALASSLALLCCLPLPARGASLGDWRTGVTTNGKEFFAYTLNDSGQAFGEWCSVDSGYCTWMIGMSYGCDKNFAYPVLANSDAEAESLSMNCSGTIEDTDLSRYAFTDFKLVKASQGRACRRVRNTDAVRSIQSHQVFAGWLLRRHLNHGSRRHGSLPTSKERRGCYARRKSSPAFEPILKADSGQSVSQPPSAAFNRLHRLEYTQSGSVSAQ